ncbi:recombinase family protein [Sphingopyxis sp. 2PD]|uniref:recombinase family protein n=1 Tax=Sphingopyxis sp. 2PD TaxID=2502196 RepID=UPI0010F52171|nr:recombinase family protein [Sphingopyxis sp. 2PD]
MADRIVRCAIYTRKSTEDGLEQEFNSLDAQYEACVAYATSQRHEGWKVIPERYDDGGFSGGNMERPGLKQLLADVAAGKVDVILLYKIDRLTRSLSDFARIVDVLDQAGASFVSITQSFNTTTSMGRLTLNMLLSFAQFEREVTGERIRDKIAASKRKGIWMGGPVPLGYIVRDRKLIIEPREAEQVRHIMRRYLVLGSVRSLVAELNADGYRTKVQNRTSGPHKGGCPYRRGTIYHMLANRMYRGDIVHKGEAYPGEHEPIVSEELWDEVQRALANRSQGGSTRQAVRWPSLLINLLHDGEGRPMSPSHSTRKAVNADGAAQRRRYRYYQTRPDAEGGVAWRVTASDIEPLIRSRLAAFLEDQQAIIAMAEDRSAKVINATLSSALGMAAKLRSQATGECRDTIEQIVRRIDLAQDSIAITVNNVGLRIQFGLTEVPSEECAIEEIVLHCPVVKVRRGHALRLILPASTPAVPPRQRDEKLVQLVAEAQAARKLVLENPGRAVASIAADHGRCRTRLAKLVGLSCLAPDIVTAIVEGRQPAKLTAKMLTSIDLPLCWREQRAVLGF